MPLPGAGSRKGMRRSHLQGSGQVRGTQCSTWKIVQARMLVCIRTYNEG